MTHLYETSDDVKDQSRSFNIISIVFRHQAYHAVNASHPNVDVHAPESPTNMHLSKDYCQEYHSVVTV